MFIRQVRHINKKNNISYSTYKLVECVRTERGPRQQTLLNLGSNFNLPKEDWKKLANCIEEIIRGQKTLFEYSPKIEALARTIVRRIIRRQASVISSKEVLPSDYIPDYQTVDINTVENEEVRTIGNEHIVYHTIKELEMDKKLLELGFNRKQIQSAIGVISARLINPSSERTTHLWLREVSGIDELMDTDFSSLSQYQVYKVSDMLLRNKDKIEEYLSLKQKQLFNLKEKIILYDLTNTFFEGSGVYNNKACFGHSKEKRSDSPLVTLGLVLDSDGFPKRSKVFPGNVSEAGTLRSILEELSSGDFPCKPVIVLDAGIATQDNLKWLKSAQYSYLVVSRRRRKEPVHTKFVTIKESEGVIIRAAFIASEESDEIELIVHSTSKERKEKSINDFFSRRFEEELRKVQAGLFKRKGIKGYEKVLERVGRLKERFKGVSHRYSITIEQDSETKKAKAVNWRRKEIEEGYGYYSLRTNLKDFKEQDLMKIYSMLTDIEATFRSMKSELGLRPIYHQKGFRVDGHLFITFLAYSVAQTIRFKLRQQGICYGWSTIRERLSTQVRITTTMKRKDGRIIRIRKSSQPELFHKTIYRALNIPDRPGKIIKSVL